MQETPAAAGEDTPEATTTRGVEAATAVEVVAAASSAPRARSHRADPSDPEARSDRAGPSDPRTPSAAGRAAEDAGPDAVRRDDDVEGMSVMASSSSSRKAP